METNDGVTNYFRGLFRIDLEPYKEKMHDGYPLYKDGYPDHEAVYSIDTFLENIDNSKLYNKVIRRYLEKVYSRDIDEIVVFPFLERGPIVLKIVKDLLKCAKRHYSHLPQKVIYFYREDAFTSDLSLGIVDSIPEGGVALEGWAVLGTAFDD